MRTSVDPGLSDAEKVRSRRRDAAAEAGVDAFFASLDDKVADESVDALTRDTLRWYVHEERDSRSESAPLCPEGIELYRYIVAIYF